MKETSRYIASQKFCRTMLRIDLTPLDEGVHHVVLEPQAQAVGLDPDRFKDLRLDAVLEVFNDRVLATLHASATATLECDRTLALFEQLIEGACRILFVPPSFADTEKDEIGYEEVRVFHRSGHEIDLTEAVRDTLLLAVPARKVAPGAEALDLPTVFGAAEAVIDPRWEALRSLRRDEDAD